MSTMYRAYCKIIRLPENDILLVHALTKDESNLLKLKTFVFM
jgi:hypothetical protein